MTIEEVESNSYEGATIVVESVAEMNTNESTPIIVDDKVTL